MPLNSLMPHQTYGLQFIEKNNGNLILADDMGLGKTVTIAQWIMNHPELRPGLIVCPQIIKLNWRKEIQKFTSGVKTILLEGTPDPRIFGRLKKDVVFIANYDIIHKWHLHLLVGQMKFMILDEAHNVLKITSQRTKAVWTLAKGFQQYPGIPHIMPVTGTPSINDYKEVARLVELFDQQRARKLLDARNEQEFNRILAPVMLRRTKEEVLNLPEKTAHTVRVKLSNRVEYDNAYNSFNTWIKSAGTYRRLQSAVGFAKVEILKKASALGKIDAVTEWIEENLPSKKVVLFAHHKSVVSELRKRFPSNSVVIDGSATPKQKELAKNRFQKDPKFRLAICNLKSAGIGVTLTSGTILGFIELPWTPAEVDQARDRIHRIGQMFPVDIVFFIGENTIDERICEILDYKRRNIGLGVYGRSPSKDEMLKELLKKEMRNGTETFAEKIKSFFTQWSFG